MAETLIQAMKTAENNGRDIDAAIMGVYAEASELLAATPFVTIQGNAISFGREAALAGYEFRGINEGYAESTGTTENVTESLVIAGGDLDVDKFLIETGGEDVRSAQETSKAKAIALGLTREFVKGSVLTKPKGLDGFQVRCTDDQLIAAGTSDGGDALSLKKLDELIDSVDMPTHLIMSKTMRRLLNAAARNTSVGGYITWDKDEFGTRIMRYNDLPILSVEKDNTRTAILPFTEVSNHVSATATASSIYCVSFGDDGVHGIQAAPLTAADLGEQDSKPVFRTRIEWYIGMAVRRANAIARLWSIKEAAVTV